MVSRRDQREVDLGILIAILLMVAWLVWLCGGCIGDAEPFSCPAPTCDEVPPAGPARPPLIVYPVPGVRIVVPNNPGPAVRRESRGVVD